VLSFITAQTDPDNIAQKTLVHASIEAGVKRFDGLRMYPCDYERERQPIKSDKAGVTVDSNGM
jgi:hypothetical protein